MTDWFVLVETATESLAIAEAITPAFVKQLLADYSVRETAPDKVSMAARAIPAPRSARNDRSHKLAYLVSAQLSIALIGPRTSPLSSVQLSKVWRTVIGSLRKVLDVRAEQERITALAAVKSKRGFKPYTMDNFHNMDWTTVQNPLPIHDLVRRPVAMPVDIPTTNAVFAGIFADLSSDKSESSDAERGKIFADGRLDMCKQVVGPPFIGELMTALRGNTHVRHFLLGNNVAGTPGVNAISEYIRWSASAGAAAALTVSTPLHTWYLAGNEIDGAGMSVLTDAMLTNSEVRYVWLKRNPIGSTDGANALARLVKHTSLRLLDLQETGLLDTGLEILCEGLRDNKTLRTLYLDGCGIRNIAPLAAILNTTNIRNLYLSVNAFRDEGCVALAAALRENCTLKRLAVSSVGMGVVGCKAICEAVAAHPRLILLDLGFYRTTIVLHELPNHLTDASAPYIATLLRTSPLLRSFSVKCCALTPVGMNIITDAIEANPHLISWNVRQHDWCYGGKMGKRLSQLRDTHRAAVVGHKYLDEQCLRNPHAVKHIRSIYRGKM
jgi:Ran GTPase-activating protein (RanGAP) involved in mRNA processing and transport